MSLPVTQKNAFYKRMCSVQTKKEFAGHLSMASSDVYAQSFAVYSMNRKCLINDLTNGVMYLYIYIIRVAYLQQVEKNKVTEIQI